MCFSKFSIKRTALENQTKCEAGIQIVMTSKGNCTALNLPIPHNLWHGDLNTFCVHEVILLNTSHDG